MSIFEEPEIAEHTAAVLTLKTKLGDARAEAVKIDVEIGRHLIAVKAKLKWGLWGQWLSEQVDIKDRWARELMNLAEVEAANGPWVREVAPLGETKALRAARASEPFRWGISPAWTWKGMTALKMTDNDFDRALDEADPGAVARPRKAASRGAAGAAPTTVAEVLEALKAVRQIEPDKAQWWPVVDWVMREFGAPATSGYFPPPVPAPGPLPAPAPGYVPIPTPVPPPGSAPAPVPPPVPPPYPPTN